MEWTKSESPTPGSENIALLGGTIRICACFDVYLSEANFLQMQAWEARNRVPRSDRNYTQAALREHRGMVNWDKPWYIRVMIGDQYYPMVQHNFATLTEVKAHGECVARALATTLLNETSVI